MTYIRSVSFYSFAVALFSLALWTPAPAHAQLGEATALFLRIEPDSRSAGMGNTGVALADNANAMFWNPAGLGFQKNTQVGITHANWLPEFNAGLFYEYIVGTYHAPGIGTFGGNITYLNLGEIELRDNGGNDVGTARAYEYAVAASYARKVSDNLSLGTNLRYIYSKLSEATGDIESGTASAVSFDLGALYRTNPFALGGTQTTFSAGFNLSNMGTEMKYDEDAQALPTNLRAGYAFTFDFDEYNSLTFTNDFTKAMVRVQETRTCETGDPLAQCADEDIEVRSDPDPFYKAIFTSWSNGTGLGNADGGVAELSALEQITAAFGLEYWYNDLFALRTGYYYEDPQNGNRELLNFGAGLRYNIVGVDVSYIYAMEQSSPLDQTLRFSLLLNFNR